MKFINLKFYLEQKINRNDATKKQSPNRKSRRSYLQYRDSHFRICGPLLNCVALSSRIISLLFFWSKPISSARRNVMGTGKMSESRFRDTPTKALCPIIAFIVSQIFPNLWRCPLYEAVAFAWRCRGRQTRTATSPFPLVPRFLAAHTSPNGDPWKRGILYSTHW